MLILKLEEFITLLRKYKKINTIIEKVIVRVIT
jgi:hypothetical protein